MRHFPTTRCLLTLCTLSLVNGSAGSDSGGCDKNAVDNCVQGILFAAEDDRSFFWKDAAAVEGLCDRVPRIPECVKNATMNCPEGAKRFLKALMKGYEVVFQSKLCAKSPEGIVRRERFANSASCLRENFDNMCMKNYIVSLQELVGSADKHNVRKACCLHRAYRICLANSITPLCGVEAASGYIQFNSMLSSGPLREICGSAYAEQSCAEPGWPQATGMHDLKGTILSRLLQILMETSKVEKPTRDEILEDEAFEFTTCTGESIDECFFGVLPMTAANSSSLWRNEAQLEGFCSRLHNVPRCLRGRAPMCHTATNEFLQLAKEEAELTRKADFCARESDRREFLIEAGRCFHENVDNNCTIKLVLALEAVSEAPPQNRRSLICCIATRYASCLCDALKPTCGIVVAEFFSSLLQRLALPGQTGCECEVELPESPVHTGTSMRSLVNALEES